MSRKGIFFVILICINGNDSFNEEYKREIQRILDIFFEKSGDDEYNVITAFDTETSIKFDNKERFHISTNKCIQTTGSIIYAPNNVNIEYFDENHKLVSPISANEVVWQQDRNMMLLLGNVKIESVDDNKMKGKKEFYTDCLLFDTSQRYVLNDSFARIELDKKTIEGDNIFAKQDLSYYRIMRPHILIPKKMMLR